MIKRKSKVKQQTQVQPLHQPTKPTTSKLIKKSEKTKSSVLGTVKSVVRKSKTLVAQEIQCVETELPSTSKQVSLTATKTTSRTTSKRTERKKGTTALASRKRSQRKRSPELKAVIKARVSTDETSPADETDVSSQFRSDSVRYSDVVRSKNGSSGESVEPLNASLTSDSNKPLENIDFTHFPELGCHRSRPSKSISSSGSTSRRSAGVSGEQMPLIRKCSASKRTERKRCNAAAAKAKRNNCQTTGASSLVHGSHTCEKCNENTIWMERDIQNSAQTYRLNLPEYSRFPSDLTYPGFLSQYQDDSYQKLENVALAGLRMVLERNVRREHSHHTK